MLGRALAVLTVLVSVGWSGSVRAATSAPGDTSSTLVLNASFGADVVGLAPDVTLPGPPAGDYLTLNQAAGVVQVVSSIDGLTNQPVLLKQNNDAGGVGLFAWGATPPPGLERVTARWRSLARDDNPVTLMRCAVRSSSGAILASVEYRTHGQLTYNSVGGATGPTLPVEYQQNRNQQFTIVVNFLAGTTSLSIDDVPMAGFQNVPFAETGTDFGSIAFDESGPQPQSLVVDDISAVAFCRTPDHAPLVTAPPAIAGEEGGTLDFFVTAEDPDGDPISSLTASLGVLPTGNFATFTPNLTNTSGEFYWPMKRGEAGQYVMTFTASGSGGDGTAQTNINVAVNGISVTGLVLWTPSAGTEGSHFVTFTAQDQFGDVGQAVTEIVVGAPLFSAAAAAPGARLAPTVIHNIQKGPVVSAPSKVSATVSQPVVVEATATDTTGTGGVAAAAVLRVNRVGSTSTTANATTANLTLTADLSQLGGDAVFIVDKDPIVNAPAHVSGNVAFPVIFNVGADDPDGDPILTLTPDFAEFPSGNQPTFSVNGTHTIGAFAWTPGVSDSGDYDAFFTATNQLVGRSATRIHVQGMAAARVFMPGNKKIRLNSNKPSDCIVIEPIDGDFTLTDIDVASIRMVSEGTGSVSSIAPIVKSVVVGDRDGNLVEDMTVCFSKADLRLLFSNLRGNNVVPVTVGGQLTAGGLFSGIASISVVAGGGPSQAAVSPNPLNPIGTLRFTTTRQSFARVRLFDLSGRLVRELLDERSLEPGDHEIMIDGLNSRGQRFASGVYFFRIETSSGTQAGRFAIMK